MTPLRSKKKKVWVGWAYHGIDIQGFLNDICKSGALSNRENKFHSKKIRITVEEI